MFLSPTTMVMEAPVCFHVLTKLQECSVVTLEHPVNKPHPLLPSNLSYLGYQSSWGTAQDTLELIQKAERETVDDLPIEFAKL